MILFALLSFVFLAILFLGWKLNFLLSISGVAGNFWSFPTVMGASFMIAWGAEIGQFFVSQGLAIALLAFLQVLPEFTVEAVITYHAALEPATLGYITANFTGANRMLIGLGWPLVFFVATVFAYRNKCTFREIRLNDEHSIEVMALLIPTLFFFIIFFKASLTLFDSALLISMYVVYLYILSKMPPVGTEEESFLHGIPKRVRKVARRLQILFVITMFGLGGGILYISAHPFYESIIASAVAIGLPAYILFQWIAPILSEFPELTTISYFGQTVGNAKLGLINAVSSKINQWTLLIGMIPIVFCTTLRDVAAIPFGFEQRIEILLTIAQSIFACACLMKLRFLRWEALTLFSLWLLQVFDPIIDPVLFQTHLPITRIALIPVYFVLTYFSLVRYWSELRAVRIVRNAIRTWIFKKKV